MVESRDPDEEQHPSVSVGLIQVQESLLGPGAPGGAQSIPPQHRGSQGCSWLPSKGQTPQGFTPAAFGFPLGFSAQCQRVPKAVGSAQSQALLRAGWLCALPAASCTPQRAAGTRRSPERSPWMWQQRWSHSKLLRPRTALTLPTHQHPLWPQPSARPGAAGKGGNSGNASQVLANAASASLGTVTAKSHPQETLLWWLLHLEMLCPMTRSRSSGAR